MSGQTAFYMEGQREPCCEGNMSKLRVTSCCDRKGIPREGSEVGGGAVCPQEEREGWRSRGRLGSCRGLWGPLSAMGAIAGLGAEMWHGLQGSEKMASVRIESGGQG